MKLNFIHTITICCSSILLLSSCESHVQNADNAFERMKKEKLFTNDSLEVMLEPQKLDVVQRAESIDEWHLFKNGIEKKIVTNEFSIKEIKKRPNIDVKLYKRITHLEKNNDDLRIQLVEYNNEERLKWRSFKLRMNQNVSEIDSVLKDITINNR